MGYIADGIEFRNLYEVCDYYGVDIAEVDYLRDHYNMTLVECINTICQCEVVGCIECI